MQPMEFNGWIFHLYAEAVAAATARNAVADSKDKMEALTGLEGSTHRSEDHLDLNYSMDHDAHYINEHRSAHHDAHYINEHRSARGERRLESDYVERLHAVNFHQTAFLSDDELVMSLEEDAADDANTPGANSKTDISNKANTIGVPVFVLNLERRHDRREHMLALLRGVGFSNVTVVNAISYEQLDWDSFQTVVLCSGP